MPKMTTAIAKQQFSRLRATASIRKSKPDWAIAFGSAMIEGNKSSVVIHPKMARARSLLGTYGIGQDKATQIKNRTVGYAWMEDGKFVLATREGTFSNAQKAFREFMKVFKLNPTTLIEGELSEEQIARNELEDEEELDRLASAPDDRDVVAAPQQDETEPADELPAPIEPYNAVELAPHHIKARDRAAHDTTEALNKVLRAVPGLHEMDQQAISQKMNDLMTAKLAALPEDIRDTLLETAPARLFMTLSRDAMLDWPERTNTAQILDLADPEVGVSAREVEDHFTQLANQLLLRAELDQTVSRHKLRSRIEAFIVDGREPDENMDGLQRLSMVLLPMMRKTPALLKNFGATPMATPDEMGPFAMNLGELVAALMEAQQQIEDCRDAHDAAMNGGIGDALQARFRRIRGDLERETSNYMLQLDAAAPGTVPDPAALLDYIAQTFRGMDNCDPAFSPTSVQKIYDDALGRIARHVSTQ